MTEDHIGYEKFMDNALRDVVRNALKKVSSEGLISHHHLYITFFTKFEGVEVPDFLAASYPEELTIVIQHQFWGLEVHQDYFSVILSFNKKRETITVPFAALTGFADPGVKFGLQFTASEKKLSSNNIIESNETISDPPNEALLKEKGTRNQVENNEAREKSSVISLDSFRKK